MAYIEEFDLNTRPEFNIADDSKKKLLQSLSLNVILDEYYEKWNNEHKDKVLMSYMVKQYASKYKFLSDIEIGDFVLIEDYYFCLVVEKEVKKLPERLLSGLAAKKKTEDVTFLYVIFFDARWKDSMKFKIGIINSRGILERDFYKKYEDDGYRSCYSKNAPKIKKLNDSIITFKEDYKNHIEEQVRIIFEKQAREEAEHNAWLDSPVNNITNRQWQELQNELSTLRAEIEYIKDNMCYRYRSEEE